MLFRITENGREKMKSGTVCLKLTLQVEHRMTCIKFKQPAYSFIRLHCPDPLFPVLYLNAIRVS
jgi:hypothetical protein